MHGNDLIAGRTDCPGKASACAIPGRDGCVIVFTREVGWKNYFARYAPSLDWRAVRESWMAQLTQHCEDVCQIFVMWGWATSAGTLEMRTYTSIVLRFVLRG